MTISLFYNYSPLQVESVLKNKIYETISPRAT